jgi:hypothetical protein
MEKEDAGTWAERWPLLWFALVWFKWTVPVGMLLVVLGMGLDACRDVHVIDRDGRPVGEYRIIYTPGVRR